MTIFFKDSVRFHKITQLLMVIVKNSYFCNRFIILRLKILKTWVLIGGNLSFLIKNKKTKQTKTNIQSLLVTEQILRGSFSEE